MKTDTHKLIFSALFVAAGVLLPVVFHMAGLGGPVFLPMHIPVLTGGLLLGWRRGLMIGILTPLLSSLLTGMPPLLPVLPVMTAELAAYGAVAGAAEEKLRRPVWLSLLAAMVAGRFAMALVIWLFASSLGITLTPRAYVAMTLAQGTAGLAIQLVFIPLLVKRLRRYYGKSGNF